MTQGLGNACKAWLFKYLYWWTIFWGLKFRAFSDLSSYKSNFFFFFLSGFSITDTDDSQDSRGMEGTFFYSTLPLPPAHEHSDIYLQLCMWDDYHVFLIATLVFTRLLLDEMYHLIELPSDWLMLHWVFCLFAWWFDSNFVTAIWGGKPVDSSSHRLSPLYFKRTD